MKNFNNTYIFTFAIVMVIVVAAILSFTATKLKPLQDRNVKIEKKRNILASVKIESTAENAEEEYAKYITQEMVINAAGEKQDIHPFKVKLKEEVAKKVDDRMLPVYVAEKDGKTKYIFPLYGKGLWGPVWGYISLDKDFETVYGAYFDHKGETPGLGAEIAYKAFQKQFEGKKMFDGTKFTSVKVLKGDNSNNIYAVDAISGGTITSDGVDDMIENSMKAYVNFINSKK